MRQIPATGIDPLLNEYVGEDLVGEQPLLKREDLLQALQITAEYLSSRNVDYELITVGGALSVILLRTRESTPDIDFFVSAGFRLRDTTILDEAIIHTVKRVGRDHLGYMWLNNTVAGLVRPDEWEKLVGVARHQNRVVFRAPGLTVLAAPWNFCFITKAAVLARGEYKQYEWREAVHFLRQYNLLHDNHLVTLDLLDKWVVQHHRCSVQSVIPVINTMYRQIYKTDGVKDLIGSPDVDIHGL